MYYQTLKAHFDGTAIVLDEPCDLPPCTPLLVLVAKEETEEEERTAWLQMSAAGLARAYGDNEPDYSAPVRPEHTKHE